MACVANVAKTCPRPMQRMPECGEVVRISNRKTNLISPPRAGKGTGFRCTRCIGRGHGRGHVFATFVISDVGVSPLPR